MQTKLSPLMIGFEAQLENYFCQKYFFLFPRQIENVSISFFPSISAKHFSFAKKLLHSEIPNYYRVVRTLQQRQIWQSLPERLVDVNLLMEY